MKGINRIVKCYAVKNRKSVKYIQNLQKKIHDKININNTSNKKSSLDKRLLKIEKNMNLVLKQLDLINKHKI